MYDHLALAVQDDNVENRGNEVWHLAHPFTGCVASAAVVGSWGEGCDGGSGESCASF